MHRYSLDVFRGIKTTVMGGDDWAKFIADFNLGGGELVVFTASQRMVKAFVCYINCPSARNNEEPPEPIVVDEDGGGEGVVPEEEALNDEHMEAAHPDIVYSRNVVLSEADASRLDFVLTINNGFIGSPFVHRLTETNVKSKLMKIPKRVAESLNMASSGGVGICLGAGLCTKIAYKTDIDGRMVLSKGWGVFVSQNNLEIGDAIVCNFTSRNAGGVNMICVVDLLKMAVE